MAQKYIVDGNLEHDKTSYKTGDSLMLEDDQAAPLLAIGRVKVAEEASQKVAGQPSNPGIPGGKGSPTNAPPPPKPAPEAAPPPAPQPPTPAPAQPKQPTPEEIAATVAQVE